MKLSARVFGSSATIVVRKYKWREIHLTEAELRALERLSELYKACREDIIKQTAFPDIRAIYLQGEGYGRELEDGFVVYDYSAPMSPANFDSEKGKTFAYENCIRKLWPLFAFARLQAKWDSGIKWPEATTQG